MDARAGRRRGDPLLLLVAVLLGWTALRMFAWYPALFAAQSVIEVQQVRQPKVSASLGILVVPRRGAGGGSHANPLDRLYQQRAMRQRELTGRGNRRTAMLAAGPPAVLWGAGIASAPSASLDRGSASQIGGTAGPALLAGSGAYRSARSRWSVDSWVLARGLGAVGRLDQGRGQKAAAAGQAGYGGSQAGAVLRYALAPHRLTAPALFLRTSGSLGTSRRDYREVAAGVAIRPVPAVPLELLAEGRAQHAGGNVRLRPAVAAVTVIPPQTLPLAFQAEIYGQAGYVAGPDGTGFFDVQSVAYRTLAMPRTNRAVQLGAGLWAGGQRGAARLDVGPQASARMGSGGVDARISLGWRFRVAGNAAPGSGPVVVVAASF